MQSSCHTAFWNSLLDNFFYFKYACLFYFHLPNEIGYVYVKASS